MPLEQFELSLVARTVITPKTLHLEFVRTDQKPLAFSAGQFITFLLKDAQGALKRRSYSIASFPKDATIALAISLVPGGFASELFANLKPGDVLPAMGPAGRLILQEEPVARYLLLGTGTGIAPYRAMLPELVERMHKEPIAAVVIEGVQYRQDLLYHQDFLAIMQTTPKFQFQAYYSREPDGALADFERQGYVQSAFASLMLNPLQDIIYLCGNPNMIDHAFKTLTETYGFATSRIRREKYISSN